MGLDVTLTGPLTDEQVADYLEATESSNTDLSRTFCHLLTRHDAVDEETELVQLGRLTGVDVGPIEAMSDEAHSVPTDNLPTVLATVEALLAALPAYEPLADRLAPTAWDTLDRPVYFADVSVDRGRGYLGNNFGYDLRILRQQLRLFQQLGVETVWFSYG